MAQSTKEKKEPEIRVRNSPAFKLKDKQSRQYVAVNFMRDFGFMPETIIVEKVRNHSNTFIIRAVLTPEEVKKEEKAMKHLKVVEPKHADAKNTVKRTKSKAGAVIPSGNTASA